MTWTHVHHGFLVFWTAAPTEPSSQAAVAAKVQLLSSNVQDTASLAALNAFVTFERIGRVLWGFGKTADCQGLTCGLLKPPAKAWEDRNVGGGAWV